MNTICFPSVCGNASEHPEPGDVRSVTAVPSPFMMLMWKPSMGFALLNNTRFPSGAHDAYRENVVVSCRTFVPSSFMAKT